MNVLVTGGAGYIGSVMVRQLLDQGHDVVVFDNIISGHRDAVDTRASFVEGDITDKDALSRVFSSNSIDAVMHFAGVISMAESVQNPEKYSRVNIDGSKNLLDAMRDASIKYIIFSSSAGVYGNPVQIPIPETHPKNPLNPYGESKWRVEQQLAVYDKEFGIKSVALRYFNAAGASLDGKLGERHKEETHLIPLAIRAVMANTEFTLFGTDYDTPDGSCVRDYIHVEDLCDAHLKALTYLQANNPSDVFNVGTGHGYSNREVVKKVEEISGKTIRIVEKPRRPGDAGVLVADPSKIKGTLSWEPKHSDLDTIVRTAWKFHS